MSIIPQDLSFMPVQKYAGITASVNSYIAAQPTGGYKYPDQCQITLPLEAVLLDKSSIQFSLRGITNGGVGTYWRFPQDVRSIFRRITIAAGSKIISDIQNQNVLYGILNDTKDSLWSTTSAVITSGFGSDVQRNTWWSDTQKVYSVQLYDLDNQFWNKLLLLNKWGTQLQFTFYLEDPLNIIETDSITTPSYELNGVEFHLRSLVPSEALNNLYNSTVPKGIQYGFVDFQNISDSSLLLAGTRNFSKILPFRFQNLLGVVGVMRTQSTLQNLATNNRLTTYNNNGMSELYLTIGSQRQPIDPRTSPADMYQMFCQLFGLSTRLPLAIAQNYDTSNFVFCVNLAKFSDEFGDPYTSIGGVNTAISSSVVLTGAFNAPLAANQVLDVFAIYESVLTCNQNGSVTIDY